MRLSGVAGREIEQSPLRFEVTVATSEVRDSILRPQDGR